MTDASTPAAEVVVSGGGGPGGCAAVLEAARAGRRRFCSKPTITSVKALPDPCGASRATDVIDV